MSADSFTEYSSSSWFSRIAGSIKGILVGVVLILLSIGLLSWNEGRAVKRYKTLKEGAGSVVTVDSAQVDPGNEGRLVHTTGTAVTSDRPTDNEFAVSAHALKLIREVEMYQWKESTSKDTKKKLGGGTETVTTYSYSREWNDRPIDSSRFKEPSGHVNPAMPFSSQTFTAKPVTVGAYTLSSHQVSMIGGKESYSFSSDYTAPAHLGKTILSPTTLYIGEDAAAPVVGDIRVSYSIVPEQDVSLVAAQVQDGFQPYQTDAGGRIDLLKSGILSSAVMIQHAQESNKVMTWILRGVGLFMMFIGFNLVMGPLSVLADIVPFIGSLVGMGTAIIALLLTLVGGFITIAVAWIVFRPVLAISLLLVAAASLFMLFKQARRPKQA